MGNDSSAEVPKFTREQIQFYQEKNKNMEDTIRTYNDRIRTYREKNEELEDTIMTNKEMIRTIMAEKHQLMDTIEDLKTDIKKIRTNNNRIQIYQEKNKEMEDTIMTNNEMIRTIMAEKDQLMCTIEDLKTDIKKKDEDTKHRINDVCNGRKNLELELNKYKSVPEFDAILNLNKDLVDFHIKIKGFIESNCEMLQTNRHDEEIEQIKKRNSELYGKLQNSSVRSLISEKSVELKEAENELMAKKEAALQDFVKINAQLAQIKDKTGEATAKFAGTIENSISELRKTLQAYQREVIAIGNDVKTADSLIHEKVKNILLQQENAMMKEMIPSNVDIVKNKLIEEDERWKSHEQTISVDAFKKKKPTCWECGEAGHKKPDCPQKIEKLGPSTNFGELPPRRFTNGTIKKKQLPRLDNDDSYTDSIVDDDSEICSFSSSTKPYKLILLNVHECEIGGKSDMQTVRKVLSRLTDRSLDDIDVRRSGESTMRPRPIVVSFNDIFYVHELLKYKHLLRNTMFSKIMICPYKSKRNAPNPRAFWLS